MNDTFSLRPFHLSLHCASRLLLPSSPTLAFHASVFRRALHPDRRARDACSGGRKVYYMDFFFHQRMPL
jgi:hypothetical protein